MFLSAALIAVLMLAQATQTPSLDTILPKILDYGVAALAIYVLLNNIRNNGKQDSDQADLLRESIKLNGKMVEMVDELKKVREEDKRNTQQTFENLSKNQAVFFKGVRKNISTMETVASEVQTNTKATIDHYKASAQSLAVLNRNFDKAETRFHNRIDDAIKLMNEHHTEQMTALAALKPQTTIVTTEISEVSEQ